MSNWFTRFTRFGDVHLVYGQQDNMSCGLASVMMCVFKLNKLSPGATALTTENDICARYTAALGDPSYNPAATGTWPRHLATVLNQFTAGNWRWHRPPINTVGTRLASKVGVTNGVGPTVNVEPVIIGVSWNRGGAHWVVVDTVRDFMGTKYATICDPWDTNVHIQSFTPGQPFLYNAGNGGISVDFGGTHKGQTKPYGANSNGQIQIWGMICRD